MISGPVVGFVDQAGDLLVDEPGGLLGHLGALSGEQQPPLAGPEPVLPEGKRTDLRAHPEVRDHGPGHLGGLFEVVLGPGGDLAEHDLLRRPAAQWEGQPVLELGLGHEVAVLEGPGHGDAQGAHPAGDDRYPVHRVDVLQPEADHGVAHLVGGDPDLLLLR